MKPTVVVEHCASEPGALQDQILRSCAHLSLRGDFNNANAVFIKPNLTYPTFKEGVTTRREFVECLVGALRQINSTTKIYIGEGEGGYNSFSMSDAMRAMGFFEIPKRYPNVEVVNLSEGGRRSVQLLARNKPYSVDLPELFFDRVDFSITCPLPKVHCMTKISLALKNQWGCLPDTMRLKNHYVFDEIISQVCQKLKFRYVFMDGKFGLDHNGPMMGDAVAVDWYAASNSLGAFDMVVSDLMGFDWRGVRHLRMAELLGHMPSREEIRVIGEIDRLRRKFSLRRNVWNYPALTAFHSRRLTHLFYFSGWAKLLHDVMYTFRKRPIT